MDIQMICSREKKTSSKRPSKFTLTLKKKQDGKIQENRIKKKLMKKQAKKSYKVNKKDNGRKPSSRVIKAVRRNKIKIK